MANEKTLQLDALLKSSPEVSSLGGNDRILAVDGRGGGMSDKVKDISALATIPSIFGSQLLAKGSDGTIGFVSAEQVFTNWGWSYGIVDDIATLNSDGIFLIMEETQGTPPGAHKRGSIVLKFTWDENAAYHLYLEYQNGRLWFQNKLHGVWLPWKQIAFVSANSGGKFHIPNALRITLNLREERRAA